MESKPGELSPRVIEEFTIDKENIDQLKADLCSNFHKDMVNEK